MLEAGLSLDRLLVPVAVVAFGQLDEVVSFLEELAAKAQAPLAIDPVVGVVGYVQADLIPTVQMPRHVVAVLFRFLTGDGPDVAAFFQVVRSLDGDAKT